MKARERDWIMVRVRREVHANLVRIAQKLWNHAVRGYRTHYSADADKLPLSNVIAELIRREDEHARRGKKKRDNDRANRNMLRLIEETTPDAE